ncbi:MAG: hypothetical protein R2746_16835 [Acidimicrobiales bacterium]
MTTGDATAPATTRLVPPRLPATHVERPELAGPLRRAVHDPDRAVVLVSAPAGAGKTTLLASLAHHDDLTVAWLQLDRADDEPVRFWTAVTAAIGRVRPEVAARVEPVVRTTRGHRDSVVSTLIDAVAEVEPFVLVLDDHHLVEDDEVHQGVDQLIEHQPATLTLAISTRVDPPLRLGRLRVRGRLHEVRNADLRMGPDAARPCSAPTMPSSARPR